MPHLSSLLKSKKKQNQLLYSFYLCLLALITSLGTSCSSDSGSKKNQVIISVADQKMLLLKHGKAEKVYPVSTSKFGLGSRSGSRHTPLGKHMVARKVGAHAPVGAVFKSRRRTGEILKPNAPGRDPIVTRILWLSGLQHHNRNTYSRYIYIHGTPAERSIGQPVSYGCIRMKSHDIIDLYKKLAVASRVTITRGRLPHYELES